MADYPSAEEFLGIKPTAAPSTIPSAEEFLGITPATATPSAEEFLGIPKRRTRAPVPEYRLPKIGTDTSTQHFPQLKLPTQPEGLTYEEENLLNRFAAENAGTKPREEFTYREMVGVEPQTMQNAWDVLSGLGSYYAKSMRGAPSLAEELGTPERPPTTAAKVASGLQRAGAGLADTLTAPENLGLLALGGLPGIAGKAVNAAFFVDMLRQTKPLAERAGEALASGDVAAEVEALADLLINAAFVTSTGKHALTPRYAQDFQEWKALNQDLDREAHARAQWIVDNRPVRARMEVYQAPSKLENFIQQQDYAITPESQPPSLPTEREGISPRENLPPDTGQIREETGQRPSGGGGLRRAETEPVRQRPVVPETPAQPYETAIAEIRRTNSRTIAEIQRLFPEAQLSREQARVYRNAAWGQPEVEGVEAPPQTEPVEQPVPREAQKQLRTLRERQLAEERARAQAGYGQAKTQIKEEAGIQPGQTYEDWVAQEREKELARQRAAAQAGPMGRGEMSKELGVPPGKTMEEYQAEELARQRQAGMAGPLNRGEGQQVFGGGEAPTPAFMKVQGADVRRMLDALGAAMYQRELPETLGRELIQNAYDAAKTKPDAKIWYSAWGDERKGYSFMVADNGVGMTPEEVMTKLLPPGATGKNKQKVTSSGGFGLAKIAIFGSTDRFLVQTIAHGLDGRTMRTTVRGTSKAWKDFAASPQRNLDFSSGQLEPNKGLVITIDEMPPGTATGTKVEVFSKNQDLNNAMGGMWSMAMQLPENFKVIQLDRPEGKDWEELNTSHPLLSDFLKESTYAGVKGYSPRRVLDRIELPSANVELVSNLSMENQLSPWSGIPVLNDGLYQFSLPRFDELRDVPLPADIAINVTSKVQPTDKTYPFPTSRESLRSEAEKAAVGMLKIIADRIKTEQLNAYKQGLDQAPLIPGTNLKLLDVTGGLPGDLMQELLSDPIIRDLATTQIGLFRDMAQRLGVAIDPKYALFDFGGVAVGGDFLGVNFGRSEPTPTERNLIFFDPINQYALVDKAIEKKLFGMERFSEALASNVIGTALHEIAHQVSRREGETHARAMTFASGEVADLLGRYRQEIINRLDKLGKSGLIKLDERFKRYSESILTSADKSKAELFVRASQGSPFGRQAGRALPAGMGERTGFGAEGNLPRGGGTGGEAAATGRTSLEEPSPAYLPVTRAVEEAESIYRAKEQAVPGSGKEFIASQQAAEVTAGEPVRRVINSLRALAGRAITREEAAADPSLRDAQDVAQRVLRSRFVERQFAQPVAGLDKSAALLGDSLTTWQQFRNDPNVDPALRSRATKDALDALDQFEKSMGDFSYDYERKKAALTEEVTKAAEEKNWEITDKQAAEALLEDLKEVGRELAQASKDTGGLEVFTRITKQPESLANAVRFIAGHADFDLIQRGVIKNSRDFLEHVKSQAEKLRTPEMNSIKEVTQASDEALAYVADLVMKSEPYRERLFEASELFRDKVDKYPLTPFMKRIAEQVKAGNFAGAIATYAKGWGNTVQELNTSRKAARVAGRQEHRLLLQLQELEQIKQLYETARNQPELRQARDQIYNDLGVKALIKSHTGTTYILTAPVRVPNPEAGQPDIWREEEFKIDLSDLSETGAKRAVAELDRFRKAAADYTSHADEAAYSPSKAAAMKQLVGELELMANPTINPRLGKIMPWWVNTPIRKFFGLIGRPDQTPEVALRYGAGFAAQMADRALNAYKTVKEKMQAVFNVHDKQLAIALADAIKSHGWKSSDLERWEKRIWNPLAGSHQYFESHMALKANDLIGNGEKVTSADMAFLKAWRNFDKSYRRKLTGEQAAESIRRAGAGVVEEGARGERRIRKEAETGPETIARRLQSIYPLVDEWGKARDSRSRIKLLDANFDQLVLGYMRDVAGHVPFRHSYRFGNEIAAVFLESRHGQPIKSFSDLAHRVADEYNARHEGEAEMIDANDVAGPILREFDGLFGKLAEERRVTEEKQKTDITVTGGENSFNSARGEQIFPSTWYDYGSVTQPQHAAHLAGGTTPFLLDFLNSVRSLDQVLKGIVTKFEENAELRRGSKEARQKGQNFYDWHSARVASQQVTDLYNKLKAAIDYSEERRPVGESPSILGAGQEMVIGSLVGGRKALIFNLLGGATMIVRADMLLNNRNLASALLRNAVGLTVNGVKLAIHEGNPLGRALKVAAKAGDFIPFVRGLSSKITDLLEENRRLYGQAADEGLAYTEGLGKATQAIWGNKYTGGKNLEPMTDQGLFSKAWQVGGVTTMRTAGRWTGQLMRMVDGFLNEQSIRLTEDMARNWEERAKAYGSLRIEQAIREGRDPYDPTDLRNLFTPEELVKSKGNFWRDSEHQAAMVREWFLKQGDINIDARMLDYVRRLKEAENAGHPGVDEQGKAIRIFTEPEMIQLRMGHAGLTNLANFGNRPIRTSATQSKLLLLLSYKSWLMHEIARQFDGLHNRSFWGKLKGMGPQAIELILLSAIGGALGLSAANQLSQALGIYSTQPTVFNAQNPQDAAQAVAVGAAQMVPFYGDAYNLATGNAYKTGWDINNQFVLLNLATDATKFLKQTWQTGDATYPAIQFLRRWTFPANWTGQFLPQVAGLQEISNTRNILNRAAKGAQMETRLDKAGGTATQNWGPTTPLLNDFANAVGKGDSTGAKAAFDNLVGYYTKQGLDPLEAKRRALSGIRTRNPLTQVFGAAITTAQLDGLYSRMTDREKRVVSRALGNYENIVTSLGAGTGLTKEAKLATRKARTGTGRSRIPGIAGRIINRATRVSRRTRNPLQRINRRLGIQQPRKKRTRTIA